MGFAPVSEHPHWEFPGSPVVRTGCFHSLHLGLLPDQETNILQATGGAAKNENIHIPTRMEGRVKTGRIETQVRTG